KPHTNVQVRTGVHPGGRAGADGTSPRVWPGIRAVRDDFSDIRTAESRETPYDTGGTSARRVVVPADVHEVGGRVRQAGRWSTTVVRLRAHVSIEVVVGARLHPGRDRNVPALESA